jgi:hypothetical protein
MAIDLITPQPKNNILAGAKLSFRVDDTYTSMTIVVSVSTGGDWATAYNSSSGAQSGFSVTVKVDGSYHIFTISRDVGWDTNPVTIRVTENETGTSKITEYSYDLQGNRPFPPPTRPYEPNTPPTLDLYSSGDQDEHFPGVSHVDVVGPPDGIDAIPQEALKIRLDATATTRDPDAIHGDEASEFDALDDMGVAVGHAAIIVLEDSEASGVKKKMETDTFIAIKEPAKLTDDLGCQLLYTFDGSPNNSGPQGSDYDLTISPHTAAYTMGLEMGTQAQYHMASEYALTPYRTPPAEVKATGEMTIQIVFRLYESENGSTLDTQLFRLQNANSNYRRTCWSLGFDSNTPGGGDPLWPRFYYRTVGSDVTIPGAGTGVELIAPDVALRGVSDYHMAARRISNGAGGYDLSIWANGMKVAELEAQVGGYNGGASSMQVKTGSSNDGQLNHAIDCCKMSNIALTDDQIISEYKKALGIV